MLRGRLLLNVWFRDKVNANGFHFLLLSFFYNSYISLFRNMVNNTSKSLGMELTDHLGTSFPSFTYYVTTLSCTIGRRSSPTASSDNPFAISTPAAGVHVDIDLGQLKSVSRLHARIEYDEDAESFVMCVLGRNGAWIDGVWAKSGSRIPLSTR